MTMMTMDRPSVDAPSATRRFLDAAEIYALGLGLPLLFGLVAWAGVFIVSYIGEHAGEGCGALVAIPAIGYAIFILHEATEFVVGRLFRKRG